MIKFTDDFENKEKIIFRDYLALERTKLANERTLFSYIRTSFYLLTAGIGILQVKSISRLDALAWICIVSGIILFFLGIIRFWQMKKHLSSYIDSSKTTVTTLPLDKKEADLAGNNAVESKG